MCLAHVLLGETSITVTPEICLGYVPFRNGAWEAMSPPADHLGLYKREREIPSLHILQRRVLQHTVGLYINNLA